MTPMPPSPFIDPAKLTSEGEQYVHDVLAFLDSGIRKIVAEEVVPNRLPAHLEAADIMPVLAVLAGY